LKNNTVHGINKPWIEKTSTEDLEYPNYLNIALGSCGEFHSCYTSCRRAEQITADDDERLDQLHYKVENALLKRLRARRTDSSFLQQSFLSHLWQTRHRFLMHHGGLKKRWKYQVNNQMRYNILITSQLKTLARYFNAAGYHNVRAMPGTQWPWPLGEFYGYQAKYYAWHFDYRGPMYGWSTMLDQYVIDFIRHREIETATRPLFVEFNLVSSHAPFHRQSPYVEDWSLIGDGSIYQDLEVITYPISWPD
jgi:hypothetical protein